MELLGHRVDISLTLFIYVFIFLFFYFKLRWVFVVVSRLLIVVASLVAERGL